MIKTTLKKYNGITVVRDDLIEGGSKVRFLPYLIQDAHEIVFGGPFCGGAPLALAVVGKMMGKKITLFYAKRKEWHNKQVEAKAYGANIIEVAPGYMTVVQARARAYAEAEGAKFLPLGFDLPEAEEPYVDAMKKVRKRTGDPNQVWCCVGSGMLARCLSKAFPSSQICAVPVGLASRHEAQPFASNVKLWPASYKFEQETKSLCPFPSCPNYDRKAWEICEAFAKGSVLFWNVAK